MRRSSNVQVSWLGSETGLVAVAWTSRTRIADALSTGRGRNSEARLAQNVGVANRNVGVAVEDGLTVVEALPVDVTVQGVARWVQRQGSECSAWRRQ
jgi:hypothetical protein